MSEAASSAAARRVREAAQWARDRLRGKRTAAFAVAGIVILLPLLLGWILSGRRTGDAVVRRVTLQPTVSLVGTLSPVRSDSYGAVVPGVELKILWLVEEGTLVHLGDRLIQFDPAPFQKELDTALARAKELSGEAEQARLAVDALALKETEDVEEKRTATELSQRELSTFVNTTAPLTAEESANEVDTRERVLAEAETKLAGLAPFVAQGYVSQEEYRSAAARRDQAAADLKLARSRHAALVHETNPDLIRRKAEETESSRHNLEIVQRRGRIEREQAQAAARVAQARLDEANRQIAEAQKRIAACTVVARAPGLAVHADVFDKTGERRKSHAGDSVWGGTIVVALPDLSRMQIEGRVPESAIHLLAAGQRARLLLDAFPGLELTGVLKAIGSVGTSEKNESRSFPVTIAVDQSDPRFRPGMIGRCSVSGDKLVGVLSLPIETIHSDERGAFVYLVSMLGHASRRGVTLGISTSREVEIRAGLKAGDVVRAAGE